MINVGIVVSVEFFKSGGCPFVTIGVVNFFNGFFKLDSVNIHIASATAAHHAYLTADAHHQKIGTTAGMRLFEMQNVARSDLNNVHK